MNCALHAVALLLAAAPAVLQVATIGPYPLLHTTAAFEASEPMGGAGGGGGQAEPSAYSGGPSHG